MKDWGFTDPVGFERSHEETFEETFEEMFCIPCLRLYCMSHVTDA